LCEHDTNGRPIELDPQICCPKCNPLVPLDIKHGQRVLEHCAAHILHDPSINEMDELCGLCLRPAPMCTFYLRKGNGGYQIDWSKSTCLYEIKFQYAVAATSSTGSPCSNVPVICEICGPKSPAIWRYNLNAHFRNFHRLSNPTSWPVKVLITEDEKTGLSKVWATRNTHRVPRNMKRTRERLVISEAHSSRLAFR
jgi:hypothetical protein